MSVFPPGLEPLDEVGAAAWAQEALAAWPDGRFRIRDLVPPVFEAYARILHGTGRAEGNVSTGTWGELAAAHGVDLGQETSFAELSGLPPESREWDGAVPMEGSLTESEVTALRRALERHTATPERCLFLLWAGYGFLSEGGGGVLYEERSPRDELRDRREARAAERRAMRFARRFAKIELLGRSGRTYFLLSGPVSAAERFTFGEHSFQSPNVWWPDDRAWLVHTEIDYHSTYVGGSRGLVEELLASDLECLEVQATSFAGG
ncbi:MAG: hypothetical protein ACRD3V_26250, partial [Vicinamibacteria bacterium]